MSSKDRNCQPPKEGFACQAHVEKDGKLVHLFYSPDLPYDSAYIAEEVEQQ